MGLGFVLFGKVVEAPLEVEHEVAGEHGAEGFGARLGVGCVADVAEIVEHVVAVDHQKQLTFERLICEACVPDEVVGIEGRVGVTASIEHGEIGRNLEVGRQVVEQGNCGAERPGVLIGEVGQIGGKAVVGAAEIGRHCVVAEGVVEV